MATNEKTQALLQMLREMSPADLSILQAVPQDLGGDAPVQLATIPDSNNDRLWSEMAKLGWMTQIQPLETPMQTKVFLVNSAAKDDLEELLTMLKRDELPNIFNALRQEIPPKIVPPVIEAGGTPADVSMMLAGIVEATMRRWIKDELHEEFLADISKKVRALLPPG